MKTFRIVAMALTVVALVASSALATTIFTASGPAPSDPGYTAAAQATFSSITSTGMTITLTNTSPTMHAIGETLTGIIFAFSSGTASSISLSSVSASGGVIDCTSGTCVATSGSSPYTWGTAQNGSNVSLRPGGGTGTHPYEIVNSTINAACTGSCTGGLDNGPHNPYLLGNVQFVVTYSGFNSAPDIASVTFLFGTGPDSQTGTQVCVSNCGQVPEPGSMALMFGGLAGLIRARRRRA